MPRGSLPGERRGGRQKGTPNKRTVKMIAEVEESGLTPLDFLISVMRDETVPRAERMEAAAKAAPYVHPKLATVAVMAEIQVEQPIDFSMLDVQERQQLRVMLEKRAELVPELLVNGAGVLALPLRNDDLEGAQHKGHSKTGHRPS